MVFVRALGEEKAMIFAFQAFRLKPLWFAVSLLRYIICSLAKTARNLFAIRVAPGVRYRYKRVAARGSMTMGELLERALGAYEKQREP